MEKNWKKIGIVACVALAAALALAGCASEPAQAKGKASGSFMDQAREYERGGNYSASLAAYSVAKATGEIEEAALKAEFARMRESLGATKFNDCALEASEFCTKQSDIASKQQNDTMQGLLWSLAALDLAMAVE